MIAFVTASDTAVLISSISSSVGLNSAANAAATIRAKPSFTEYASNVIVTSFLFSINPPSVSSAYFRLTLIILFNPDTRNIFSILAFKCSASTLPPP